MQCVVIGSVQHCSLHFALRKNNKKVDYEHSFFNFPLSAKNGKWAFTFHFLAIDNGKCRINIPDVFVYTVMRMNNGIGM